MLHEDRNWPRASDWLKSASGSRLGVLGVPTNKSITPGRCDLAPAAMREALVRFSTYDFESNVDVRDLTVTDFGDVASDSEIQHSVSERLRTCEALVLLGGDNYLTRPAVLGLGLPLRKVGVITLDAHLDLRDLDGGLINGNPIRALLADGLPGENITQIGIQSFANSPAYAHVAYEAGINLFTAEQVHRDGMASVLKEAFARGSDLDALYFDLDLDVMDRAFAPGTPGSRPGGLTPGQAREAAKIMGAHANVRVMDLVELDPSKDINDATAMAGAACLLSFASGMLSRPR